MLRRLDPQVGEAYQECQAFTRRRATNFYIAFSALPALKRRAIYAAYAYAGTVDDAVDDAGTQEERAAALAQAQGLLSAVYDGGTAEPAWLATGLGDAVSRFDIPREHFDELVLGMEHDLTVTRYETYAELEQYCYRAASVIGLICICIFGYDRTQTQRATQSAIAMGKALQITNIMRDVKEDAERGRIYLAQEDLARHGVSEQDILDGAYTEPFRELMADYAQRAYALYHEGDRLIPLLSGPRSRACCNGLQGVYRMILDAIVARDYDVFSQRVSPSRAGRVLRLLELWLLGSLPNVARVR
ncbi:MAG: squalene/phytoene synthase family protein [Chloroflexi bacterium]|nr:squalene/phytoene synthase family protein [Chloroflexota bacterium]MCY3696465.1 squalene/phytoene synthase family protein [Chloroflexota bacterium]